MPDLPEPDVLDLALRGDEPPAVVGYLASGRSLGAAATSTLLDLAARGHLELRQPGGDPRQTTVHLTTDAAPYATPDAATHAQPADPVPTGLMPYERRVLARLREVAVDGMVPLGALAFRDADRAGAWATAFTDEVMADARARGLAPAGNDVTARWLDLRAHLRDDEAFARLPPSAVAVWGRYLAYGAALGVNRACQAVIDFGLGHRGRVWSCYGGGWHQVRVRYPAARARYGLGVTPLLLVGAAWLVLGCTVLRCGVALATAWPQAGAAADRVSAGLTALGAGLFGFGAYWVLRTVLDLVAPRRLVGEVLWLAGWKHRGAAGAAVPIVHYLAVDAGSGDRTTAWALPSGGAAVCAPGDVVELTVRPWSRRVIRLARREARSLHGAPAPAGSTDGTPAPAC